MPVCRRRSSPSKLPRRLNAALIGDFLFDFPIPAPWTARTAFLRKALAGLVPRPSRVVRGEAGFASDEPAMLKMPFCPSILATLFPASPASPASFLRFALTFSRRRRQPLRSSLAFLREFSTYHTLQHRSCTQKAEFSVHAMYIWINNGPVCVHTASGKIIIKLNRP